MQGSTTLHCARCPRMHSPSRDMWIGPSSHRIQDMWIGQENLCTRAQHKAKLTHRNRSEVKCSTPSAAPCRRKRGASLISSSFLLPLATGLCCLSRRRSRIFHIRIRLQDNIPHDSKFETQLLNQHANSETRCAAKPAGL